MYMKKATSLPNDSRTSCTSTESQSVILRVMRKNERNTIHLDRNNVQYGKLFFLKMLE